MNKWDLCRDKVGAKEEYISHVRQKLSFLDFVPVEFSSAKTGYHVNDIMDLAIKVFKERSFRFTTQQLNELLQGILLQHKPPIKGKLKKKLL